ncbi:unnamed protein product [Pleuronectes platessa]|uniref:Uncharacterized protein n=1 Tax=Pleuronectes platessa TaxID=8262 RepID=A0A9N7U2H0_PLEPL|nr:unnamed protein product [Pleuronectes platessa]
MPPPLIPSTTSAAVEKSPLLYLWFLPNPELLKQQLVSAELSVWNAGSQGVYQSMVFGFISVITGARDLSLTQCGRCWDVSLRVAVEDNPVTPVTLCNFNWSLAQCTAAGGAPVVQRLQPGRERSAGLSELVCRKQLLEVRLMGTLGLNQKTALCHKRQMQEVKAALVGSPTLINTSSTEELVPLPPTSYTHQTPVCPLGRGSFPVQRSSVFVLKSLSDFQPMMPIQESEISVWRCSSDTDLILNLLNTSREKQTRTDDIIRHSEPRPRIREPGVLGLLQRKASGGSHLSPAQRPNEPVLYWEPTRWMEPLHPGGVRAKWRRHTARLFDSRPSPPLGLPTAPIS